MTLNLPRPGCNNPVENFTTLQEKCEGDLHLPFYVSASDAYKNEFCALCRKLVIVDNFIVRMGL
ncbi:hypothetical protein MAR_003225 [Mya arenaria]|uniref:Uncharacterized protein n=1 Tax=Mya arenaria TaxID=6604 RepID=A0ABY7G6U1_MYAAR|nr:hypothetical protein MAR_003225 [Mya arenaria]